MQSPCTGRDIFQTASRLPLHREWVEVKRMTTHSRGEVTLRRARAWHHQAGQAIRPVAPLVSRRTNTEDMVSQDLAAIEEELRAVLGSRRPAATEFWQMLYYHMGWEHLDQPP